MAKSLFEFTVEARTENLDEVLAFVDEGLEERGCEPKTRIQIDVAVEEIFVNIAHYAYFPDTGSVTARMEFQDNTVAVTFIDGGVPYNPLAKPDPDVTLPAEERPVGGLGIYMVKKSMDSVSYEYRDGRNIFTMRKALNATDHPGPVPSIAENLVNQQSINKRRTDHARD